MIADSLKALNRAFNNEGSRFIVVGGLAVVAHGYVRATQDLDIVIELIPENIEKAFNALASEGYQPAIPVSPKDFSDPKTRKDWIKSKQMTVLQFWSDLHKDVPVDVFVESPFDFQKEWDISYQQNLDTDQPSLRFATIDSLIQMKKKAGRPQDLVDIEQLEWIRDQA